jgi:hypothetical protein
MATEITGRSIDNMNKPEPSQAGENDTGLLLLHHPRPWPPLNPTPQALATAEPYTPGPGHR